MASGLTSPAGDELERLRQHYDRLCDLMARTAESDPAAAERVLTELQALSERILQLETSPAEPPAPARPAEAPASVAASAPLAAATPSAAPTSPPDATGPAEAPPPEGQQAAARIVAFRVTPSVGQRPAGGDAAAPSASWRLDAPPAGPGRQDMAAGVPSPASQARTTPPARQATAQRPPTAASPAPRKSITIRKPTAGPAASISSPAPPPAQPRPPETESAAAEGAGPAAPAPQPPTEHPQPAARPAGNATLFGSAIRQWLERHRAEPPQPIAAPATALHGSTGEDTAAGKAHDQLSADASPEPQAVSRIAAAVEQQALRIERILQLCESHQAALERLEARMAARLEAPPPAAAAGPDPELPDLRAAIAEQRQRITSLAKTIHNLAQWLATQRGS